MLTSAAPWEQTAKNHPSAVPALQLLAAGWVLFPVSASAHGIPAQDTPVRSAVALAVWAAVQAGLTWGANNAENIRRAQRRYRLPAGRRNHAKQKRGEHYDK